MATTKARRGRPARDPAKVRGVRVYFRVTASEDAALRAAARAAGRPYRTWLRERLLAALG